MKIAGKYLTLVYTILLTILFLVICYSSPFAAPLSDEEAIKVVQSGYIIKEGPQFGFMVIWDKIQLPIGKIGIKTAMASHIEDEGKVFIGTTGDLRKYTIAYKKELDLWVKCGIIQYEEFYYSESPRKINFEIMKDGHKYLVSLTKESKEISWDTNDPIAKKNLPTDDKRYEKIPITADKMWANIYFGKRKVINIVKNLEVKDQKKYGTKDIRLVMGIYEFYPTEIGKKYFDAAGKVIEIKYKFRTIIEYDPFKKGYQMLAFDSGNINSGAWLSNNVVE